MPAAQSLKEQIFRFWVRPLQIAGDALGADFNTSAAAGQNCVFNAAGLTIKSGGSSPQFLTANTIKYLIAMAYKTLAAQSANSFSAAVPVIPISSSCVFLVQVDAAGNLTTKAGSVAAGATGSVLPIPDAGKAGVGMINVATDGTHTFTPATTNLDGAGITATYTDFTNAPETGLTSAAPYPRAASTNTRATSAASVDNTVPEPPETLTQFE